MTVMEDKIVNTILSDDELLTYVENLVSKRLPAGPHFKSDYNWYKQVIDLSINQAFEDLQVVDTLNYQISQLGKYLKKNSKNERVSSNDECCEDADLSLVDNRNIDHPSFSSSEPVQRSRKQIKDTTNKLNHAANDGDFDRNLQNQVEKPSEGQKQNPEPRRIQETEDVTSNPTNQRSQSVSNSGNRQNQFNGQAPREQDTNSLNGRSNNDTQIKQLAPSISYKSDLNNLQETVNSYSNFLAISAANESKKFSPDNELSDNDFPLKVNSSSNGRVVSDFAKSSPSRYANLQPKSGNDSVDSDEEVDIRNAVLKVKSPLVPTLTNAGFYMMNKNIKNSYSQEEDYGSDVVFLKPIQEPDYPLQNGISGLIGPYESSLTGSQADTIVTGDGNVSDSENWTDREKDAERDSNKDDLGDEYVKRLEIEEEEKEYADDKEEETEEEPYYDSDFEDNKADTSERAESGLPEDKPMEQQNSHSDKKGSENSIYASWSLPSDNVNRVRFVPDVVSDVFIVREKHSSFDIPSLFYTHDESIQFTSDYNRESLKAEAQGLTWYEWWEDRTEEDVARDDKEQLEEVEYEYESESEGVNDDMSGGTDDFNF